MNKNSLSTLFWFIQFKWPSGYLFMNQAGHTVCFWFSMLLAIISQYTVFLLHYFFSPCGIED